MSSKKHRNARQVSRTVQAPDMPAPADSSARRNRIFWLWLPALLLATLLAYRPVWHGGLLWDDNAHITAPDLRGIQGLPRIWFDLGATQQYYPVVHTAFWILYSLWGEQTLAYHLTNILLHVLSAFLLALILRRLSVPGAWLAAMIFALHPVQVESVAWISELKNTLSGAFYLGAALSYLCFAESRRRRFYAAGLFLFAMALLSKSVTATLPAGLLILFWWQRRILNLRRDVLPLVPFFALGIAGGLLTVWVERTLIGAEGAEFNFNLIERCLIAGRAIWFYLAKLVWPVHLVFQYPRWQIDSGAVWQYLYPLGAMLLLAGLWKVRKRSRAPLAAMVFYCVTLFPALGFFNVYPFVFSFVADHFQYLASIGMITLFAAAATRLFRRWKSRALSLPATAVLAAALAALTWGQSRAYANAETLYRTTIERNPTAWMAYNNLGSLKLAGTKEDVQQAMAYIQQALKLKPDYAGARMNLGTAMRTLGNYQEALAEYKAALSVNPNIPEAYTNLGATLRSMGRLDEAIVQFREALRRKPDLPESHLLLGEALQESGRPEEALPHIREALKLNPDSAQAYNSLGNALQRMGRLDDAIPEYEHALRIKPDYPEAHTNLGAALQAAGRLQESEAQHREALRLKPDFAAADFNLGKVLLAMRRMDDAEARFRDAIVHDPHYIDAYGALGTVLQMRGKPEEAIKQYEAILRLNPKSPEAYDHIGMALQQMGRSTEAIRHFREALKLNPDFAAAHYDLGIQLHTMGRLQEAIDEYREAIRLSPEQAEIHNHLGIALAASGRLSEAVVQFKEALRINPEYAEARANLARASR